MAISATSNSLTVPEYLAREVNSSDRHEYHAGRVVAMAGGTPRHSQVIANTIIGLGSRLRGNPCRVHESNTRIAVARRMSYVYPDVAIICGEPVFDPADAHQTTVLNPKVLVEVLSDSTEMYDRGRKFDLYREIPSLEEYILISTNAPAAEAFYRQPESLWLFSPSRGLDSSLRLRSLNLELPLSEIYDRITFDDPQPT